VADFNRASPHRNTGTYSRWRRGDFALDRKAKDPAAVALGRRGGHAKSEKKADAVRKNLEKARAARISTRAGRSHATGF
jgi:hypothetical protein